MTPRSSQDLPGREVPERSWVYRLAKGRWFNDFGVYDGASAAAGDRARVPASDSVTPGGPA
jgi:hypothetical protein